jgi:glutamine amidotransferase
MRVDILDIGSGNIRSVQNFVARLHVPTRVITKAVDIKSEFLILPGVGSAGSYMNRMKSGDFDKAVLEHVYSKKPILGICLGFQIMANFSEEDNGVEGLGIINGRVEKIPQHNGWEDFNFKSRELEENPFTPKLKLTRRQNIKGRVFFNHEYGFVPNDSSAFNKPISNVYNKYSSMVVKENIIGFQFHPEKSQKTGLELISMIL